MPGQPVLTAGSLVLRPPSPDDAPAYRVIYGHDADTELSLATTHWALHGFGPWLVLADGEPAAAVEIGLASADVEGVGRAEVEVGWVVAAPRRGQGIATAATRLALEHVFSLGGVDHVVACIRPGNASSHRVAEKLGFRERGPGRSRTGAPVTVFALEA